MHTPVNLISNSFCHSRRFRRESIPRVSQLDPRLRPAGMTAITIMIFFWAAVSSANAQGMLPAASTTTVRADTGPLLIGQTVPENLVVLESSTGTPRALLSYKAAIEVLVVQFLSPNCKDNQDQWTDLKIGRA